MVSSSKLLLLSTITICGISVGVASADTRYTLDFNGRPGPSGIPGAADQILYTPADITNYGGYRDVSQDFAGVGIHFSPATALMVFGGD